MSNDNRFTVGDEVEWSSQANGTMKIKKGRVVAVVQAERKPWGDFLMSEPAVPRDYVSTIDCRSLARDHESYVVAVGSDRRKTRLYWPRVSQLRKVQDEQR